MPRAKDPLLALLLCGMAVEFAIAVSLGGPGALRLMEGRGRGADVLAAVGLFWLPVLAALFWAMTRRLVTLREELADRDGHLEALAATSYDWLWQSTADLRSISASPACIELLGYQPDELIGRCMLDFVQPEDATKAQLLLADAVQSRKGWIDVDLRWRHAAGHAITLQGNANPILDSSGRVSGFRGTWRAMRNDTAALRRTEIIAHRTRNLIAARAINTALQPIVDLSTGRWVGAEALSRFPDNVNPDTWFASAHDAGVGVALELYALESAIELLPGLPDSVYLSVNASPAVILDAGFELLMRHTDLAVDHLVVEITEHTAIRRYDDIRDGLRPHRERGLRLAVDDAGAGFASFNHVLKLRPDIIKLDRSLVTHIDTDSARRALVTAIVMIAIDTEAQVTAEGVETTSELETLRRLGVTTAQGYLLARPSVERDRITVWQTRDWTTHAGLTEPAQGVEDGHIPPGPVTRT